MKSESVDTSEIGNASKAALGEVDHHRMIVNCQHNVFVNNLLLSGMFQSVSNREMEA